MTSDRALITRVLQHSRNKFFDVYPDKKSFWSSVQSRLRRLSDSLRVAGLSQAGAIVVVSEQTIEVPMVMRQITEADKDILDFGGFESTVPLQLAGLGHSVTVWDQRPYPFKHSRINVFSGDIFAPNSAPQKTFDLVFSISTIEHLGLGNYGDLLDPDGDRRAAAVLWDLVKPGGKLVITVPAGVDSVQRGYRVFDAAHIRHSFPFATRVRYFMKRGKSGEWNEVDEGTATTHRYENPMSNLPVEAVAIVMADKSA